MPASARSRLLLTVGLLCCAQVAGAQQFVPTGRGTLRGLTGVEVVVEPLAQELTHMGVSVDALRASIVKQLADARITVYPSQQVNTSPAQPYLYVHVNAQSIDRGARQAVAVQLQLRQTLQSIVTGSRIVDAMTWDAHNVLVLDGRDTSDLAAELQGYVDLFIEDWVAVH